MYFTLDIKTFRTTPFFFIHPVYLYIYIFVDIYMEREGEIEIEGGRERVREEGEGGMERENIRIFNCNADCH